MEHVKLQAFKETTRIQEITKTKNNNNTKTSLSLIRPLEVKQYLFKITYDEIEKEERPLIAGKLDISWRNSLGESGRLQTTSLSQIVSICRNKVFFLVRNKFNIFEFH